MQKPKIFVFSTSYYPFMGGAEIAIQEVLRRLNGEFDFCIITSRFRRDLAQKEVRPEGTVLRLGLGNYCDKFLLPLLAVGVLWKEKKASRILLWGVDVSTGSLGAVFAKWCFGLPFVFTIQYGGGGKRLRHGRCGSIGFLFRLMLASANFVTAISGYLIREAEHFGYRGPMARVHNGVDTEKFRDQNSKIKNTSENSKVIITTSRLVRKNGIDILIQAVVEVKKMIPDIQCWIFGDGPERKNLELLTTHYSLQTNIRFFGSVPYEDLPRFLHQSDVFVRPSRSEGMGNSFVEALAAGVPIVGTPVGGILDIIEDKKTGFFACVDDPADLAQKVLFVLANPDQARATVAHGTRMVEDRFQWRAIAQSYADVFGLVLKKRTVLIATGLFPPDIGGPATYSKTLLEELPKRNFLVSVESFGRVRSTPKVLRHLVYLFRLLRSAPACDIIFAQDPVSVGLPAILVAAITRKKFVLKIVGDYAWEQAVQRFGVEDSLDDFLQKRYGWRVELLRVVERFVARRANTVITPSVYLKKVVEQWGVESEKIKVVYNAFAVHEDRETRAGARKKFGLEGTILISAGRMVPWKGFEMLIRSMPDITRETDEAKLLLIGSGPEEKRYRALTKELHLEKSILFLGTISHDVFLQYLKAGDVFVLNTGYEGLSHTVLEAMASDLPIITTTVGGNPELIKNGESGVLLTYNDASGFKNAIRELARNHDRARMYATAAKKRLDQFTKEKMIESTISLLQNI